MMFLLGYINQLFTVFFVLNDASKVCESHDPILLLSQCIIVINLRARDFICTFVYAISIGHPQRIT